MTELTKTYIYQNIEPVKDKSSFKEVLLIVLFSAIASVSAISGIYMFLKF